MKLAQLFFLVLIVGLFGCQADNHSLDLRPKDEIAFLNRVNDEMEFNGNSNAADKDAHVLAFNKYVRDSVQHVTGWEMIVTGVNDDAFRASSTAQRLDNDEGSCYNVMLAAPIKPYKGDPLTAGNEVEFTYSLGKNPDDPLLIKRIEIIKALNPGDTVIVSGAVTHLDGDKFLNFEELYGQLWNIDLVATKFEKKHK